MSYSLLDDCTILHILTEVFVYRSFFVVYPYVLICFCINIHIVNVLAPKKYGNKNTLWLFSRQGAHARDHSAWRGRSRGMHDQRGCRASCGASVMEGRAWRGHQEELGRGRELYVGVSIFISIQTSGFNLKRTAKQQWCRSLPTSPIREKTGKDHMTSD